MQIDTISYRKYFKPLLLLVTTVLYYHTFLNGFVQWDDPTVIEYNRVVTEPSFSRFVWIFFNGFNGVFRPVTYTVYMITFSLFGLEPAAYHGVSLLFHLLTVLMVFNFVFSLSKRNWNIAAIASIVFALHPMHVESVAWASALCDPISGFFFFAALSLYTRYAIYKEKRLFWLSFLFALTAMLSKPTVIIIPILMLLIDWFLYKKITKHDVIQKWLFFLFAAIVFFATYYVRLPLDDVMLNGLPLLNGERLLYPFFALSFYFLKFLAPIGLSAVYTLPDIKYDELPTLYYFTPILLVLIVVFLAFNKYHRREFIFGFLFLLISILPVMQIIPFGKFIVAERYVYFAYVGFGFLLGIIIENLRLQLTKKTLRNTIFILFGCWIIFLSATTINRVFLWENSEKLFTDVVEKYEREPVAWSVLAADSYQRGNLEMAEKQIENYFVIEPTGVFPFALICHANVLYCKEDYKGALEKYKLSSEQNRFSHHAWHGIGNCYLCLGDTVAACESWNQALKLRSRVARELIEEYCK